MATMLAISAGHHVSSHWPDAGPSVGGCLQCHHHHHPQDRIRPLHNQRKTPLETAPGTRCVEPGFPIRPCYQSPEVFLAQLTNDGGALPLRQGGSGSWCRGEHTFSPRAPSSRLTACLVVSCDPSMNPNKGDLDMAVPLEAQWRALLPTAVLTAMAALVVLVYLFALPRPLPGIPYNKRSSRRLFGDVSEIRQSTYRRQWIWSQPSVHGAPISQAFLFPFRRPTVIVSDYRTAVDICSRRTREFDRGTRNRECVGLTAPNFHFSMQTSDPRLRRHRELLRDLMTPWFLREVGFQISGACGMCSWSIQGCWSADIRQSRCPGRPLELETVQGPRPTFCSRPRPFPGDSGHDIERRVWHGKVQGRSQQRDAAGAKL